MSGLPSPFPKQFLVDIDEQQLDLDRGYPTHVLGQWYERGVWWYYLFGLAAKESVAFWIVLAFVPAAMGLRAVARSRKQRWVRFLPPSYAAAMALSLAAAVMVLAVLTLHHRMGLNVRYAIPALPALYLALAIGTASSGTAVFKQSLAHRGIPAVLALIALAKTVWVFPNQFAYINM